MMEKLPATLRESLITAAPPSGYYVPNFISIEEESQLLQKIDAVPLPTWRNLSHRRLQAHPSPLSPNNTLLGAALPSWLSDPIIPRLLDLQLVSNVKLNIFSDAPHQTPNHCLINEYLPGQGIHPHEDGDAYHPVVATVSLGSHIVLDVKSKSGTQEGGQFRMLQEPRSMFITTGLLYTDYLHGIGEVQVDENLGRDSIVNWDQLGDPDAYAEGCASRQRRISLTLRDVKKVRNLGKAFDGLRKR